MKTLLDLQHWPRHEHFQFFRKFDEPFFGVVVEIDCTKAYENAKILGVSFFIYYLHKTLVSTNNIEAFRYRIENELVYTYDKVDASATISRADGSFGFSFIEFHPDFHIFNDFALKEIERVKSTTGLFTCSFESENLIHFSAIPWVNFTSLSHAQNFNFPDSCPKISFGKMMVSESGKRTMAMSIHVHHGLMDGLHVSQFVDSFQNEMNNN